MSVALDRVETECRELVRARGLDPTQDASAVRALAEQVVTAYLDRAVSVAMPPLGDAEAAVRALVDNISGFGPLQHLLDDPAVEEIWINEPVKTDLECPYVELAMRCVRPHLPR